MSRYAEGTQVPVDRSKAEIEATLIRYGADQFMSGWDAESTVAVIGFRYSGRYVRIHIPLPDRNAREFTHYRHSSGSALRERKPDQAHKVWEQACRQRWRALALVVKAKLEACAAGISTFEAEFLAWTLMSNGKSVGEWIQPQLEAMYASGKMPPLLPGFSEGAPT